VDVFDHPSDVASVVDVTRIGVKTVDDGIGKDPGFEIGDPGGIAADFGGTRVMEQATFAPQQDRVGPLAIVEWRGRSDGGRFEVSEQIVAQHHEIPPPGRERFGVRIRTRCRPCKCSAEGLDGLRTPELVFRDR
jgi:hypothetical protein